MSIRAAMKAFIGLQEYQTNKPCAGLVRSLLVRRADVLHDVQGCFEGVREDSVLAEGVNVATVLMVLRESKQKSALVNFGTPDWFFMDAQGNVTHAGHLQPTGQAMPAGDWSRVGDTYFQLH